MPAPINSPLEGAIYALENGFKVFPCEPNGKRPAQGIFPTQVATDDVAQVYAWWTQDPAFNVGLVTTGWLVLDEDKPGAIAALASQGPLPETRVHTTPSGGRHLIYKGADVSAKFLAAGIDVKSHHGYIVGPGSSIDGKRYAVADAREIAQAPAWLVARQGRPGAKKPDRDQPVGEWDTYEAIARAARLLRDAEPGVSDAGGNDLRYKLACRVRDFGVSERVCVGLMLELHDPRCFPPYAPDRTGKLIGLVHRAYKYAKDQPGNDSEAARIDGLAAVSGLLEPSAEAPSAEGAAGPRVVWPGSTPAAPRSWIVKGLISERDFGFIAGESGSGKSFAALDLALSIASARSFFRCKVKKAGGVVYIPAEGEGTVADRLQAALKKHPVNLDAVPLAILGNVGNLMQPVARRSAIDAIAKEVVPRFQENIGSPLQLVIIDTMAAAFNIEDENAASEAAKLVAAAQEIRRALGCAVLLVHHYGKSDSAGMRGSSAFGAAADVVVTVRCDGRSKIRTVRLAKIRIAEVRDLGTFTLTGVDLGYDEDGDPIRSCYVDDMGLEPQSGIQIPAPPPEPTGSAYEFMKAFNAAVENRSGQEGPREAAPRASVSRAFHELLLVRGVKNDSTRGSTVSRAFKVALKSNYAEFVHEGKAWIRRRSEGGATSIAGIADTAIAVPAIVPPEVAGTACRPSSRREGAAVQYLQQRDAMSEASSENPSAVSVDGDGRGPGRRKPAGTKPKRRATAQRPRPTRGASAEDASPQTQRGSW